MSTQPPSAIFRDAANELAQEFLGRQFRDSITNRDAAEYVTSDVACSWIALELCDRPAQSVLSDLLEKLTHDEAHRLLSALLMQDGIPALADLSRAMHAQVAHDLAYEAQKLVDNYEPTDDEMNRPITRDDVSDPFLAERRAFARRHNASLRVSRV